MRKKDDLHSYQIRSITELYERDAVMAIIPMGGGKTVSAMTATQELIRDGYVRKGIVLAPKRVARIVWPVEVDEWEHLKGALTIVHVDGSPTRRKKLLDGPGDLFVIGIDNTQWLTDQMAGWADDDPRLDLLIIDELSRYKAPNGKRGRNLSFVADRFKNRWGLTGTPRPNNDIDMYRPARILARDTIWPEPFDYWREKYFIPEDLFTRHKWNTREEWQEKIWRDIARFSFSVDESELPPQPELRTIEHWVDLPAPAMRQYHEMLRHFVVEANGDVVEALNAAVASGKLDQIVQGFIYKDGETLTTLHTEKLATLQDLLAGLGGEPAMITYWFKEDLYALRSMLGQNLPVLGSVTSEKRAEEIVQQWNAGKIEYLAVHPASAGHGLNLQKGHAGQIIHYCPTWSAELYDQVNKRIARQGNNRDHVMNHLILARGTTDELKRERVQGKMTEEAAFKAFVANLQTET